VNHTKSKFPIYPEEIVRMSGVTVAININKPNVIAVPISIFPQAFFGNLKNLRISGNANIASANRLPTNKYPKEPFGLVMPGMVLTKTQNNNRLTINFSEFFSIISN